MYFSRASLLDSPDAYLDITIDQIQDMMHNADIDVDAFFQGRDIVTSDMLDRSL